MASARPTVLVLTALVLCPVVSAEDVPLALWTHDDNPSGLPMGWTHGVSWGDFDADGYVVKAVNECTAGL